MRALALVLLTACWSAPPPKVTTSPIATPRPTPVTDAVLTGRVVVDGKPVPELALGWTKRLPPYPPIQSAVVHQSSGRFEVHLPPGTWTLTIAGPGFAHTVLPERELRRGSVTDLGEISPRRGFTVTGDVTDANGNLVADAEVTILNSHRRSLIENPMIARLQGDFVTVTDKRGRYRIDGVTHLALDRRANLRVRRPDIDAILPQMIPAGDLTRNIVLQPSGTISGTAPGPDGSVVVYSFTPNGFVFADIRNGAFEVHDLPAGTYSVHVGRFGSKQVTVVANQVSPVQFP